MARRFPSSANPGWVDHPHLGNCWRHEDYPGLVVASHTATTLLVTHLAGRSPPKLSLVEELAALAVGPAATPFSTVIFPLVFRLPMEGPGILQLPSGGMTCRRVWPASNEPAYVERIEGVDVELRITATARKDGLRLYTEAFISGPHERARRPDDEPATPLARALLFDADARHVLTRNHEPWRRRFTARVMDRLLAFAYERSDVGLSVEPPASPLPPTSVELRRLVTRTPLPTNWPNEARGRAWSTRRSPSSWSRRTAAEPRYVGPPTPSRFRTTWGTPGGRTTSSSRSASSQREGTALHGVTHMLRSALGPPCPDA